MNANVQTRPEYWVALERVAPGRMRLVPVRDAQAAIVDFRCAGAGGPVLWLLNHDAGGAAVEGRRLSELLSSQEDAGDVLQAYIAAVTHAQEAVCFASITQFGDRIQHRLFVSRHGVDAELRDVDAAAKARSIFDGLRPGATACGHRR